MDYQVGDEFEICKTKYVVINVIRSGYNRKVYIVRTPDGSSIIVKVLGTDRALEVSEIQRQFGYIQTYRNQLSNLGIPVPDGVSLHVEIADHPRLIEFSSDLGTEVGAILRTAAWKECRKIIMRILRESFLPLFGSIDGSTNALDVGIDPLARNFVYNGRVTYVDLFPVKITVGGVKKLEFPEPDGDDPLSKEARRLGLIRHYSPEGILYVFFLDLCRQRPEFRPKFRELVHNFCRNNLCDMIQGKTLRLFASSPANGVSKRNGDKNQKIIDSQSGRGFSYFFLRGIACELACKTGDSDRLGQFFSMTHFQEKAMTNDQIKEAKEFLSQWAKLIV